MHNVSVIVPNLHSPYLGEVIDELHRQSIRPREVIIVGQDRYGFARNDGMVRFINSPVPLSPAQARNVGVAYAQGDICAFLDSDCVPCARWLENLLCSWDEARATVGSIDFSQKQYWEMCDTVACFGLFLPTAPPGRRPYLLSGNMAIDTRLLRRMTAFDTQLRTGEDADLSFRLRLVGVELHFEPNAVARHYTTRTTAQSVWWHMYIWGRDWPAVSARYRSLLGVTLWDRLIRVSPQLAVAAIPVLAARDALGYYASQPGLRQRHRSLLPGVVWARTGWYAGVVHGYQRVNR